MAQDGPQTSLERGAALIRRLARSLPDSPGVYRMLNDKGDVLYVGKARALRRRVVSYANIERLPLRLKRMVAETVEMVFVHTHTEAEALLLESNLIKKLKPRYNILMRDDKSFPYIFISGDHDFPLLTKHRGARNLKGEYYGPFASAGSVNRTIDTLQRVFMLRNCTDSYFAQRKRPCLQYHIKRCTAPCVGFVSRADYARQVDMARAFLKGRSSEIQQNMANEMQQASAELEFEKAARLRDRIRMLTTIQSVQDINVTAVEDADVIGLHRIEGRTCIQIFFFRNGRNYGNRPYFPRHAIDDEDGAILQAFIGQFYANKPAPSQILISHAIAEQSLIEQALSEREAGNGLVKIIIPQRGAKKSLIDFVVRNAREALEQEQLKRAGESAILEGVAKLFGLPRPPRRIEVYDNSHISGTNMVGAMIVAGPDGLRKNAYRKFNIREAGGADDYAMMREVMERRFGRAIREGRGPDDEDWPDLVLIDGGAGQLSSVMGVANALGIADKVCFVGIAKGEDRNAGREKFFIPGQKDFFQLPFDDPVLHYLQRLRDEAHRFAIGAHRTRRVKQISENPLDDVPGIGPTRKRALLHHFGSAREAARAGIKDLLQVEGISEKIARQIYHHFHDQPEE